MMTKEKTLPTSSAEAQGIPSGAVLGFIEAIEEDVRPAAEGGIDALHSFMLLRHGHVVAEGWWSPYAPEHPHMLFSLSKSFTSTGIGFAVAEGLLSVDDPVLSFFPDEAPDEVSDNLAAMKVRHLLTMTTGHDEDTTGYLFPEEEESWARIFLALPVEHEPGTHFLYNTGASFMLSAIVQKLTGRTLLDYLQDRLFGPLGIERPAWQTSPEGINLGGTGLSLRTEDIARFGQFLLQKGVWQGKQLLPASWIEEATSYQVPNAPNENPDWEQGYGYQFWQCRYNAYRGDGAFGQYCLVMPEQDAVLAITSGTGDLQAVLDKVWAHLLPAMAPEALPEDPSAQRALAETLDRLALPPVSGDATSSTAERVTGVTYHFDAGAGAVVDPRRGPDEDRAIETVRLDFTDGGAVLTVQRRGGPFEIACDYGAWREGVVAIDPWVPQPMVASGAWTAEDTYTVALCLYETPFCPIIRCRFEDDGLHYQYVSNVGFGPTEGPELIGHRSDADAV
ncbi:MAG: serine hydrolase domain-containing protein [Anaerolineae bacterium]